VVLEDILDDIRENCGGKNTYKHQNVSELILTIINKSKLITKGSQAKKVG